MRRLLILTTALIAGGLLTACGDSTGPGSIFGTYNLVSINGEDVPFQEGGFEVTAGWVRLDSDSTYTISLTSGPIGTPETETFSGTFAVDGSSIEFHVPDNGTGSATGTLSGNTITLVDGPFTLVFRK
jgi:hypothetical protein